MRLVPRRPLRLYKYLPPDRIDTLADMTLRFTPPDQFNDPFEALPRVTGPKKESIRRKLLPGEDLDTLLEAAGPYVREKGPGFVLSAVSQIFGVLSLAAVRTNPLLWAHYSKGHRGFAIGLDPHHEWFLKAKQPQPPIDAVQRVSYKRRRPAVMLGYSDDFSRLGLRRQARAMLFTKYVSWQYEAEWRLIRPLGDADRVATTPEGGQVHLFNVPREAVAEVVIGARMADLDAARVMELVSRLRGESIAVSRAHVSSRSFEVELRPEGTA